MEQADEAGMRAIADENCTFVHIGMTCELDEEIGYYTSGAFQPTSIVFHGRTVKIFGDTARRDHRLRLQPSDRNERNDASLCRYGSVPTASRSLETAAIFFYLH